MAASASRTELEGLSLIVACLAPHARAFLRESVAVTVAAAVSGKDRRLMLRVVEKVFSRIEAQRQADLQAMDSQAWLRRQLEGLDGGRA